MDAMRKGCLALLVLTLFVPATWAMDDGFGLYGGYASHTSEGEFVEAPLKGIEWEFTSSGLSLGIDYQFALGDSFSINPFLMSSSEEFEEETNVFIDTKGGAHGILGVQFRLWFEPIFVGAHVGNYSEVIEFETGDTASASGPGYGVIVGYETEGGLFFSLQRDSASLKDDGVEIQLTGTRAHIGYRWK